MISVTDCLYLSLTAFKSNSWDISIFSFQNNDAACVSTSFISSIEYVYIQKKIFFSLGHWNIISKIFLSEYILHLGNDSVNIRLNFASTTSFWQSNIFHGHPAGRENNRILQKGRQFAVWGSEKDTAHWQAQHICCYLNLTGSHW